MRTCVVLATVSCEQRVNCESDLTPFLLPRCCDIMSNIYKWMVLLIMMNSMRRKPLHRVALDRPLVLNRINLQFPNVCLKAFLSHYYDGGYIKSVEHWLTKSMAKLISLCVWKCGDKRDYKQTYMAYTIYTYRQWTTQTNSEFFSLLSSTKVILRL